MIRWLRRLVLSLLSLVVVGYVAAAAFLAIRETALVYPGANRPSEPGGVPADSLTVPWDTVSVLANDGVRVLLLRSTLSDAPDAPWILYFHGKGALIGDRGSVNRYKLFRDVGFNVLAAEYRGYGDSGDATPSETGVYADARAAWSYLTGTLHVDGARVVIYGWSLGSGVATELATEVHPAGLVTEGTFTSAPAVGRVMYPWAPTGLIMENRFDNLSKVKGLNVPHLLLHGRKDDVVPLSQAERILAAAPDPTRLVSLDAGHSAVIGDGATAGAALSDFSRTLFGGGGR